HLGQRGPTVDLGLTPTQEIQIRAVDDADPQRFRLWSHARNISRSSSSSGSEPLPDPSCGAPAASAAGAGPPPIPLPGPSARGANSASTSSIPAGSPTGTPNPSTTARAGRHASNDCRYAETGASSGSAAASTGSSRP